MNAAHQAHEQCSGANRGLQQCRTALETCADQARRLEARLRETRATAVQASEMLERIKLVALNTGLEGARLGEPAGKALVAVAEEVRTLSSRSLDVLTTHLRMMDEAELEQQKLVQSAELVQSHAMDLAGVLRQTLERQGDALAALATLEQSIERASGLDAGTAAELQSIAQHGQGLIAALESLSVARRRRVVKNLLLPTLEPLLRSLLSEVKVEPTREPES
jgi:methyl-accepting chemotaxis protein